MFDLNKAILKWKKGLRKNKSFEDGNVEELEIHLRDTIESELKLGVSAEEAFEKAVKNVGEIKEINKEYKKSHVYSTEKSKFSQMWMPALFSSYFKIALRSLKKNKSYSIINIGGLAIGLAVCIFITLFIRYELSFDKHNKDKERIYRVVKDFVFDDGTLPDATRPPALAPALAREIPEIEEAIRRMPSWGSKLLFQYGEMSFYESSFLLTDSNFFSMFSVTPLKGNLDNALTGENNIVITESMAQKYFGSKNPIDEVLETERNGTKQNVIVKAVIKDFPRTLISTLIF